MDDGPRRICLPLSFSLSFSLFSKVGLCVRRRQAAAAAGGGDGGGAVAFHQSLNRNELATLKMIETHTQTALPAKDKERKTMGNSVHSSPCSHNKPTPAAD